jgi:hypothetical protein
LRVVARFGQVGLGFGELPVSALAAASLSAIRSRIVGQITTSGDDELQTP